MMPEPGTSEYEKMIDFMRADLESGMAYTKLELATRKMFKEQGRDFNKEFKKFQDNSYGRDSRNALAE